MEGNPFNSVRRPNAWLQWRARHGFLKGTLLPQNEQTDGATGEPEGGESGGPTAALPPPASPELNRAPLTRG